MSTLLLPHDPVSTAGLLDITRPDFKADPFLFYARLRTTQPVYRARMGRMNAWLITRYDDVLAALKDERLGKNARRLQDARQQAHHPWVPDFARPLETNMLDQDDPEHARLRTLVHRAFTPARIEQLRGRVHAIASERLDAVQPRGALELIRDFALPLPLTVITELLGVPAGDRERFRRLTAALLRPPTTLNLLGAILPLWSFMRYLRGIFAERRARPQDDLLTALLQAEEAGDRLSEDELLAMVFLLLIAGHETTVNLIASGTLALLEHPGQLQLLRTRPELIRSAVEELLRFTCPVETATERYAREDLTLQGQTIRRGELVLAVIASANRDEHVFARPDELDLTREPNRHLAFGQGSHFCLGAPLARLEGQIAINLLVERLPGLRLAVAPEKLRWRATPVVRGLEALPLAF
jgi:cytochrome P450